MNTKGLILLLAAGFATGIGLTGCLVESERIGEKQFRKIDYGLVEERSFKQKDGTIIRELKGKFSKIPYLTSIIPETSDYSKLNNKN